MKCDNCKTDLQPWELPKPGETTASETGGKLWLILCDRCLRGAPKAW